LLNETIIEFKNVSYLINNKIINKDICIKINSGDLVSIIGPNGSGKSTMIKLVSGEIQPSLGKIFFNKKEISDWDVNELACLRSILSQSNMLSFPFLVRDIIKMGRYPINISKNHNSISDNEIINKIIKYFDLSDLRYRNYLTLSGGEQQRVQLARVFAQIWNNKNYSNKLLLLDEPISFLDIYHQIKLFDLLKKLNDRGLTVVMVLHDINQAKLYSKKVIMMRKAEVKCFGDVKDTLNENSIQKIFNINYKSSFYNLEKNIGAFNGS